MAASDANPWVVKAAATRLTFPVFKNDGTVITGATGVVATVSKDGGTAVTCTNAPVEIATASGVYYLDLTASETNAETVAVKVTSTSTGAVVVVLVVYTVHVDEPTAAPAFGSGIQSVLGWLLALSRNRQTQTAAVTTLRNDADSATLSTSAVSDDATTFVRGEWS